METITPYIMTFFYFAVALLLIFVFSKENKIFTIAGGAFALLGAWNILGFIMENDVLSKAPYTYVPKVIYAVLLVLLIKVYIDEGKKSRQKLEEQEESGEEIIAEADGESEDEATDK